MTQPVHDSTRPEAPERDDGLAAVDLDGLLVALVLVPKSYPRNRFYELFRDPAARRVRRRAALVRSIIADLADGASDVVIEARSSAAILRYRQEKLGATRTSLLSDDELALVQLVLERPRLGADPDAVARVHPHLLKLFER